MTVQFTISDEEQYDRDENCFSIKTNMTEDCFRQVLKLFDVYLADYPRFHCHVRNDFEKISTFAFTFSNSFLKIRERRNEDDLIGIDEQRHRDHEREHGR